MSALTSGFLRRTPKYLPAEVPDAVSLSLAAQGAPQAIFQYGTLATANRAYVLAGLSMASTAGVNVAVTADGRGAAQLQSAAVALLPATEPPPRLFHADFRDRLQVTAANTTTAALDPWWALARIRILTPSIGLRVGQPGVWPALGAGDQALATKFDLTGPGATGSRALDFAGIRDRVYAPHVRMAAVYGQAVTATSAPSTVVQLSPAAGEVLVLRAMAVSAGTGSDGLTVHLGVDEDSQFASWPAYGLGNGNPVGCFIQATETITLSLSATTSTGATLAASIWSVQITPAIAARLDQSVSTAVADAVRAGVA